MANLQGYGTNSVGNMLNHYTRHAGDPEQTKYRYANQDIDQTERLEAENRDLKSQLALSRALEGFHFPWTRDRIRARYLLPGSDSNQ